MELYDLSKFPVGISVIKRWEITKSIIYNPSEKNLMFFGEDDDNNKMIETNEDSMPNEVTSIAVISRKFEDLFIVSDESGCIFLFDYNGNKVLFIYYIFYYLFYIILISCVW
jgi:hypothetical protein